jgi:hypothetical protein
MVSYKNMRRWNSDRVEIQRNKEKEKPKDHARVEKEDSCL